jgi:hypothetical protein
MLRDAMAAIPVWTCLRDPRQDFVQNTRLNSIHAVVVFQFLHLNVRTVF